MRFINIQQIAQALSLNINRVDDTNLQLIKTAIHDHFTENNFLCISDYNFSFEELIAVLNQLKKDKYKVFYDWVTQDDALFQYLSSNGTVISSQLNNLTTLKDHQLFEEYQSFLSPFLTPLLKDKINQLIKNKSFKALEKHLIFCSFLPTSKKIEVQQPLSEFISIQLKEIETTTTEGEFESHFNFLYSASFVSVLNQLESSFYSTLIKYIDRSKEIIKNRKLNKHQLSKVKTALIHLNLTAKHQNQVQTFCQSEVFQYKTNNLTTIGNWIKSPIFLIALGIVLLLLIIYTTTPNKTQKNQSLQTSSGIDSLTDSELDQIDSLYGFKTDSTHENGKGGIFADQPEYIITANMEGIKNTKAKALYSSFITDYQIQKEKGWYSDCKKTKKSLFRTPLYNDVQPFSKFSSTNHTFKNDSEEEVYIFVFEPEKHGQLYGALVAPETSFKMHLKKGENVIFYSGRKMKHFSAIHHKNNGYGNIYDAKKVNQDFNYHFCLQNTYNFQQLNRIYKVVAIKGTTTFKQLSNGSYSVKSKTLELKRQK